MTSRRPKHQPRRERDAYYTPESLGYWLVQHTHTKIRPIVGDVLEPHVGGGAFAYPLTQLDRVLVLACDTNPDAPGLAIPGVTPAGHDFLEFSDHGVALDWIIGNPPYADAEAHVRHALDCADNVAFLLRLGFLESRRRIPFWRDYPASHVVVLSERPSFTGGSSDSAAYGWFVWLSDHTGGTRLTVESWK